MQLKTSIFKYFIGFVFLFSYSQYAYCDSISANSLRPIVISEGFVNMKPINNIKIWNVEENFLVEEIVHKLKNDEISIAEQQVSQGFSHDYFWIGFYIENQCDSTIKLFLEIDNPHIDTIAFYKANLTNLTAERIGFGGDMIPFYARTIINRRFIFPIVLEKNESEFFVLMVDNQNVSVNFPLMLWNKFQFEKEESKTQMALSIYFGYLFSIVLLTFFVGVFLRNKILLSYTVYVTLFSVFLFVNIGWAFQFFYPEIPLINDVIRFPFSVFLIISFLIFSNYYIGTKQYSKVVVRIYHFIYFISVLNLILWSVFYDYFLTKHSGLLVSIQYLIRL